MHSKTSNLTLRCMGNYEKYLTNHHQLLTHTFHAKLEPDWVQTVEIQAKYDCRTQNLTLVVAVFDIWWSTLFDISYFTCSYLCVKEGVTRCKNYVRIFAKSDDLGWSLISTLMMLVQYICVIKSIVEESCPKYRTRMYW